MGALLSRRGLLVGAAAGAVGVALGGRVASAAVVPGAADWMGALGSSTPLTRVSIPGTHGSGTRVGGAAVANQDLSIGEQLAAGVRFLDIRCRLFEGSFSLHHSSFYQRLNFDDVLVACRDFLAAHPGEVVLMRVKQEYSTESDAAFGAVFAGYAQRYPGLLRTGSAVPSVGEARGQVVVVSDNGGVPGIGWNSPAVDLSDDYDIATLADLENRKWPGVAAHFDAARAAGAEKLFITFTSSWGWALWPRDADRAIWPKVSGYLDALETAVVGVVPVDFTTAAKARQVYRLNFGR
ncbi:phosphatidylinositol-specific phospholipase C [Actinokineospora bangkokensis]|uniref:1-phosphatidylinositol phosphodiesterase n=1 Tax=Actinokineospora bangkokensis TaxID=1193682 RepID=A0A1Q9LP36_9PSEU|nr:phosphatidylinositol-specific phospholipase C [Actinokineospora bangkokensis]OLR93806.1 hypothetical protein BJP25_16360 [Actinokineospora bangkokensis]